MKLDNKTQTLQKEKDEDTKTIDYLAKTKVQKKEEQTQQELKAEETKNQYDLTKANVRKQKEELKTITGNMGKAEKDLVRYQSQFYEHKANQDAQLIDLNAAVKELKKLTKQKDAI